MASVRNSFKVPKRQWRKWSQRARHTFNELYRSLRQGWETITPPGAHGVPHQARRVTAWNAAWLAADAVREHELASR